MRILALDCSSAIGWAVFTGPGEQPRVGTWKIPALYSAHDLGARFHAFDEWLRHFVNINQPQAIAYEAPITWVIKHKDGTPNTSADQVELLVGLTAVVQLVAYEARARCIKVPVHIAKERMTGDSRAKKPRMIAAAVRRGWMVADDHQADALAVGLVAYDHLGFLI